MSIHQQSELFRPQDVQHPNPFGKISHKNTGENTACILLLFFCSLFSQHFFFALNSNKTQLDTRLWNDLH